MQSHGPRMVVFFGAGSAPAKLLVRRKNLTRNHLSPSRRRALCPFFVQSSGVVQNLAPLKAAAGSVGCLAISLSEKKCKELLSACTKCRGWQQRVVILKGPVYKGYASKKRQELKFSISA